MPARATESALGLPFHEACNFFLGKTSMPARAWTDVWQEAHTRSFMVAGAMKEALVTDFRRALQRALDQGSTLEQFRKDFDRIVARHGWTGWKGEGSEKGRAWRTRIIYETNLNMAYSAGRYAQMTDPDVLRVYPYWVYRHSGNPHPRLQHKAWDGLTLEATDSFWTTHWPPNGWNCGCTVEPISARGLVRQGKTGPDKAPPLELEPRTIGKTGRVEMVPKGIDPGFAYNPGRAWKGEVQPPQDAVMRTSPGWRPPPPAPPAPGTGGRSGSGAAADLAGLDRGLRSTYDPWSAALSDEEMSAIAAYKDGAFADLNGHLSGLARRDELKPILSSLDRAIASAPPVPESLTLFRGIGSSDPLLRAKEGKVYRHAAFASTTLDRFTADLLAGEEGAVVEIRVPQGYHGAAYIHPYPAAEHKEYEVLFRPGSRFRVVQVDQTRVILEAIDEPTRRPRLTARRPRGDLR